MLIPGKATVSSVPGLASRLLISNCLLASRRDVGTSTEASVIELAGGLQVIGASDKPKTLFPMRKTTYGVPSCNRGNSPVKRTVSRVFVSSIVVSVG